MRRFLITALISIVAGSASAQPLVVVLPPRQHLAMGNAVAYGLTKAIVPPPSVTLGQGYDILTGNLLAKDCARQDGLTRTVFGDPPLSPPSLNGGFIGEETNLSQESSLSGLSASASLTYDGFTIGAAGGSYSNSAFTNYNHYIRVIQPVTFQVETITPMALGPNGAGAFKNGESGFYSTCGRMYVSAIYYGARLDATITINTKTEGSGKGHREGVSAGITGLLGVAVNHSSSIAKIDDHGTMTYSIDDRGGSGVLPDAGKIIDYAEHYRDSSKGAHEAIAIELMPYRAIAQDGRVKNLSPLLENVLFAVSVLAEKRDESQLALNNLLFAKQNPGLYTSDKTTYDAQIKDQQDYLQAIAAATTTCQKALSLDACVTAVNSVHNVPPYDAHIDPTS